MYTSLCSGCYYFNTSAMNQTEARTTCGRINGSLVEIETWEEQEALAAEARERNNTNYGFWIGLKYEEDSWVWEQSGEEAAFTAWAPGKPSQEYPCAIIWVFRMNNGTWTNQGCATRSGPASLSFGAICELQLGRSIEIVYYYFYHLNR